MRRQQPERQHGALKFSFREGPYTRFHERFQLEKLYQRRRLTPRRVI